jgi:hypothetical protein
MGLKTNDPRGFVGIVIYSFSESGKFPHFTEILYGIEEEQIPFWIEEEAFQSEDILSSAYRAANNSVFGVGICCTPKGIAIHHSNLRKENPVFYIPIGQCTQKTARILGANAARLIKGTPFEII